ncbi:MAG: ABC transporter ATP-binding protein [Gemmatimonadota bacterium]
MSGPTAGARLQVDAEKQLDGFHLAVELAAGTEILVLFGPSGAGKSSTLDAVAGLLSPDAGRIALDGEVYFRRPRPGDPGPRRNVPARRRGIGYVFQDYALFPHLTAAGNVAFALRRHPEHRHLAHELLERMSLLPLAGRYPRELSGGQQQRVAIARALASRPRLLLLDEPFAALDLALKSRLQEDLRQLQRDLELVVLYVTHNLDDAFAIGDRLAVVRDGQVRQVGPVEEVFRHPADESVAGVMGIRNLFRARLAAATPAGLRLEWDGLDLEAAAAPPPGPLPAPVTVYIQPEQIKVIYPGVPLMEAVRHNLVEGCIRTHRRHPGGHRLQVALGNGHEVEIDYPDHAYAGLALDPGAVVQLSLRREAIILLRPHP